MRLLVILPALILLACSSAPADSPDPDQYLDRVRQMHAENRAQFEHLTTVTFAPPVAYTSDDPNEPTPTDEESKRNILSLHAPMVADLSRASRFLRRQLDELNTIAVPEEYTDLHADLITMWEAGLAWVDDWLESTQDVVTYLWTENWEAYDAFDNAYNEEVARRNALLEQHINASRRVDFVLFGTPEPEPFDISGSSTAWALTPLPPVPTATRGPAPTATPASTPERIKITKTYEIRMLNERDKLSQEEAMYLHVKAWEKAAVMADAGKRCGINIEEFNPSSHHPPHVAELWYSASASVERYEEAALIVVEAVAGRGADLNLRLSEEDWAAINDVFVQFVIAEQTLGDNVERLLEAAECPN